MLIFFAECIGSGGTSGVDTSLRRVSWVLLVQRSRPCSSCIWLLCSGKHLHGVESETLIFPQLVKNFRAFYVTRRFITMFTTARNLSPSWARSIQPTHLTDFLKINFYVMFPSMLRSSKWSLTTSTTYRLLNAIVALPKNCPFGVHIKIKLRGYFKKFPNFIF